MRPIGQLLALLLILQSLALGGPLLGEASHAGAVAGAPLLANVGRCAPDQGDDKAPAGYRHAHCCILCAAQDLGAAAPSGALASGMAPAAASVVALAFFRLDVFGPPLGWTSSWSSRAPPALS